MKRAQLSLAGLVFLVVLSLLLLFGQSLARRTLEAFEYLVWLGSSTLRSIDQVTLWSFLILIAALAFAYSLLRQLLRLRTNDDGEGLVKPEARGRLAYWVKQSSLLSGHFISESYALVEFRRLVTSVIAHRLTMEEELVEKKLRAGELEVPPEVASLFNRSRRNQDRSGLAAWLSRLWSLLPFAPSAQAERALTRPEERLSAITTFIERQLEENDDTGY